MTLERILVRYETLNAVGKIAILCEKELRCQLGQTVSFDHQALSSVRYGVSEAHKVVECYKRLISVSQSIGVMLFLPCVYHVYSA